MNAFVALMVGSFLVGCVAVACAAAWVASVVGSVTP